MEMNLSELFEVQRKLDEEIERKHPTAPGEDRLAKRILALQVELGELANEWRGFKFWSLNQNPRVWISTGICKVCAGTGTPLGIPEYSGVDCWQCGGEGETTKNPLLEEYVDCLHFILSIGLETERDENQVFEYKDEWIESSITRQFILVSDFTLRMTEDDYFFELVCAFINLGEMLGFTWEQIETAYMSKNKTNWERQENGY